MGLLNIERKKGLPDIIDGRLIAYAKVALDPSEIMSGHPIASMIHNGLLVAQGNYKEQSSLKDFLRSEMGDSFEEGLEVFIDKLDGIEGALDPQKLKDKMKNLDDLKDFIPTPAKIVPFHSEAEILQQEGDIYYVGSFKNMANANLSVNSFPIIYQARFREQELVMIKSEIDLLINQIERNVVEEDHYSNSGINIGEKILKDYIPSMLYNKNNYNDFKTNSLKLESFLRGYKFSEHVEKIIKLISETRDLENSHYKLLELYAKRIEHVYKENFSEVDMINKEIVRIENTL